MVKIANHTVLCSLFCLIVCLSFH